MLAAKSDVFARSEAGSGVGNRSGIEEGRTTVLTGFRDFILRGNVVELAVAVVIGVAFGAVVNSVVTNLITPLIALVGGPPASPRCGPGPSFGAASSTTS